LAFSALPQDGSIIIQRDHRRLLSPKEKEKLKPKATEKDRTHVLVKHFALLHLHDFLRIKLAPERHAKGENHLYHDIERGMLLKPILDLDGPRKRYQGSDSPAFLALVGSIVEKLCAYLGGAGGCNSRLLQEWTAVHLCDGDKASAHVHILRGTFAVNVDSLRLHMQHWVEGGAGGLTSQEKEVTDWGAGARVGAFRDTGMAKLEEQHSTRLRRFREVPDEGLSGAAALGLFQASRREYEMLLVPTLVPAGDIVANRCLKEAPPLTQGHKLGLKQGNGKVKSLATARHDTNHKRDVHLAVPRGLMEWLKWETWAAFGHLPVLDRWNVAHITKRNGQHAGGEQQVFFSITASPSTRCEFQGGHHSSPGHVNCVCFFANGNACLKCFSPKCSAKRKTTRGCHDIYEKLEALAR